MYKNLLIIIIITIFAGCSAPKPDKKPNWYTSPPKDYKNFYAVAAASNEVKAKGLATISLRERINAELDSSFKAPNHKLSPTPEMLKEIIINNARICNELTIRGVKIEKSEIFNGQTLILISMPREELFKKLQVLSDNKFKDLKLDYNSNKNLVDIKRYVHIKPLMSQYAYLASLSACKEISISTFSSSSNFRLLKALSDEYEKLKSTINFYILSDGNSRIYTKAIKEAIKKDGFTLSRKMADNNTLKVIITSKTTSSQEYTFMVSKNLVKFTTYDADKNKVSFRQHTFVGKSRKSLKEAKHQTSVNLSSKIRKLGIFNFIGMKKK